jgi:hypothetical protein
MIPERPVDLARDDELLDALGRGELPDEGDEVMVMLAAWRSDVTDPDAYERARTPLRAAAPALDIELPDTPVLDIAMPNVSRRRSPRRLRLAIAAAMVAVAAGGTVVAAASTTQDSPLWPITRLLYPQRAERIAAEDTLAQARQAISEGRRDDAQRLLQQADTLISQVDDPGDRASLLAVLAQLRQLLSSVTGATTQSGPSTAAGDRSSGGPTPNPTPKSTPDPLLPNPLPPGLLPPSLLPPSLLPSPLLPTSLLPLPPLPGI